MQIKNFESFSQFYCQFEISKLINDLLYVDRFLTKEIFIYRIMHEHNDRNRKKWVIRNSIK